MQRRISPWWLLGLLWLWLGVAPEEGVVGLRTSLGAKVVVYPRSEPSRIDIMVRGNRTALDQQTDGLTAQFIDEIDAMSIGGGTWFVTVHLKRPEIVMTETVTPGRVLFRFKPGTPQLETEIPAPSLDSLIATPPQRRPAAPIRLALTPLRGDASTLRISAGAVLQELPLWRYSPVDVLPVVGWPAVESYRHLLTSTEAPEIKAAANYRLGMEYLGLGWYREAAYYLESTLGGDGPFDGPAVALAAARAHLVLGRTHRTRELCKWAREQGAAEAPVLVCLGTASLNDGEPAPTETARALLSVSRLPEHRLLAGQLLMADHRNAEARRVLESLAYGTDDPWVHASLGDARYLTSDVAGAREAWARASARSNLLRKRLVLRLRMAQMLDDGFEGWASRIPELLQITEEEGPVAAEAHYLLAQIAETYSNPDLAAEHLNRLWDRFPEIAKRSDVPERLVEVCRQRLDMLHRQDAIAQEVSFFTICWRPELDTLSSDPDLLQRTAQLYVDLGLRPEGLSLQLRAMAIHTRLGRDEPKALAALTRMYAQTGRPTEALQTLSYAEAVAKERLPTQAFLVAEAEARLAAGDPQGALGAWKLAEAEQVPGAERAQGLILASLGECAEAEVLLRDAGDDDARLVRGRCLADLGRNEEAAAMLPVEGEDPLALADAAWLRGLLATRGARLPEPSLDLDTDDTDDTDMPEPTHPIWAALVEEEKTAATFEEKLDARRP